MLMQGRTSGEYCHRGLFGFQQLPDDQRNTGKVSNSLDTVFQKRLCLIQGIAPMKDKCPRDPDNER